MARRTERGATPKRRRADNRTASRATERTTGRAARSGATTHKPRLKLPSLRLPSLRLPKLARGGKLGRSSESSRSGQPPPLPVIYLQQHLQAALAAASRLRATPLHSALTAAVIGIAIALPVAFWLTLDNLGEALGGWEDGAPQISLFLQHTTSNDELQQLAMQLERDGRVAAVEPLTAEQALAEFRDQTELDAALELLDENPLPPVLIVTVAAHLQPHQVSELAKRLAQRTPIERMRLDQEWVERLHALMVLSERALWTLAVLLTIAVVLVTGNTIRLTIENRREEIEIIKLIGATNGFVRRPFLYEGLWYGALGGALAWVLIEAGRLSLKVPAQRLAEAYDADLSLHGMAAGESLLLLGGGGLLGLIGAWLAVSRHLEAIEPR